MDQPAASSLRASLGETRDSLLRNAASSGGGTFNRAETSTSARSCIHSSRTTGPGCDGLRMKAIANALLIVDQIDVPDSPVFEPEGDSPGARDVDGP